MCKVSFNFLLCMMEISRFWSIANIPNCFRKTTKLSPQIWLIPTLLIPCGVIFTSSVLIVNLALWALRQNNESRRILTSSWQTTMLGPRMLSHLINVRLCVTPWTVACQAPLSMGFPRQEYWSGLPYTPPGDHPYSGIELTSHMSLALASRFFTIAPPGKHPNHLWLKVPQGGKASDQSVLLYSIRGVVDCTICRYLSQTHSIRVFLLYFPDWSWKSCELRGLETGWLCLLLTETLARGEYSHWTKEGMNEPTCCHWHPCQPHSLFPKDELSLQEPHFLFHRWHPPTNHPDFLTHGQIWVSMVRLKWGPIYLINYTKNATRCSVR